MIQELTSTILQIAERFGLSDIDLPVEQSRQITETDLNLDCLLVKSDNLDALSMMSAGLCGKVDFCYIDPPYNTGGKFVYHDKRSGSKHPIWGKHSEWMSFMLPRLVLVRHLLSDSGVIAISIDDYEYAQLKILADSVFSSDCHIATLIVRRSNNGKGGKLNVSVNHEYVLLFGKTSRAKLRGLLEDGDVKYDKCDAFGRFRLDGLFRKKGDASLRSDRPAMYYPLYCTADGRVSTEKTSEDMLEVFPQDSSGVQRRWLWGKEKATAESWKLFASKKGVVYVKNYDQEDKRVKIKSILDKLEYLTERATNEAKDIFGERVFETPKPLTLIKDLVDCCSNDNAIVLDFFAGTGTTAHAVHLLQEDSNEGRRRTILVEHKHPIRAEHLASQEGFSTTADITEHRLKELRKIDEGYSYAVLDL